MITPWETAWGTSVEDIKADWVCKDGPETLSGKERLGFQVRGSSLSKGAGWGSPRHGKSDVSRVQHGKVEFR